MRQILEIQLTPKQSTDAEAVRKVAARLLKVSPGRIWHIKYLKRSVDARSKKIWVRLKAEFFIGEKLSFEETNLRKEYPFVGTRPAIIIVGAGPAGLFSALRLIERGLRPIIIERGKDVKARKFDIAQLSREHIVNPDSNYCFGEGGAGTYSDGKLYTRSTKRGNVQDVLQDLVNHGANPEILFDAHPHIGTDKLPAIIGAIRKTILDSGGEFYFNHRVEDFIIESGKLKGVITRNGTTFEGLSVILATGHSARDIYRLLHRKSVLLEAKPFALGVRIEHPQQLIDYLIYKQEIREQYLPAAAYSVVEQVDGRGVFSFCMCPGGIIVPSATAEGQVVVNGMSNSQRNSEFANSGMVVTVNLEDYQPYAEQGALAGLAYQEAVEQLAFSISGNSQKAPAQRMADFKEGKISQSLKASSYHPGIVSAPLHELLPTEIGARMQGAFPMFDKKLRGYLTNEAMLLMVESRTSSPVRIPRDPESFEHVTIANLYPCGEGAGYSGGIVSSALDGINCAEKIALRFIKNV
ncbi:MAG: NAD(P)/FAD-dependent oxidoreductase [Bacteroidetes bacterium]|nr:NAD(P)/FAD-dependent oxidoreductase [Bacteroidota bacterium]